MTDVLARPDDTGTGRYNPTHAIDEQLPSLNNAQTVGIPTDFAGLSAEGPSAKEAGRKPQNEESSPGALREIQLRANRVLRHQIRLEASHKYARQHQDQQLAAWEARLNHHRYLASSQAALMEAMSHAMKYLSTNPAFAQLHALHERARTDLRALEEESLVSDQLEDESTNLKHRIIEEEHSFKMTVNHLISSISKLNVFQPDNAATAPDDSGIDPGSSTAQPEIHPLLASFYNKTGTARMIQDRIDELAAMQEEERVSRDLKADQDEPPGTPDQEFEAAYERRFEKLEGELASAFEAAELARLQCIEHELLDEATEHPDLPETADFESAIPEPNNTLGRDTPSSLALGQPVSPAGDLPYFSLSGGAFNVWEDIGSPASSSGNASLTGRRDRDTSNSHKRITDWLREEVSILGGLDDRGAGLEAPAMQPRPSSSLGISYTRTNYTVSPTRRQSRSLP